MASSHSSSLCHTEMSWPTRPSRTLSHVGEPYARFECTPQAPQKSLGDTLETLVAENGQLRGRAPAKVSIDEQLSQIDRLQQQFDKLQASQPRSGARHTLDPISQSMPTGSASARAREDVGLQELVERELKAARELEQSRAARELEQSRAPRELEHTRQSDQTGGGRKERCGQYRSRSLAPRGSMPDCDRDKGYSAGPTHFARITQLQQELEIRDAALHRACQDNTKLAEEKAACIAAHARDIAALEHMITSVMAENKTLREALSVAMEKNPQKLTPPGVPGDVERVMISTLIHSGVSNSPLTPHSSGSASTETPPIEPEAEEWQE